MIFFLFKINPKIPIKNKDKENTIFFANPKGPAIFFILYFT